MRRVRYSFAILLILLMTACANTEGLTGSEAGILNVGNDLVATVEVVEEVESVEFADQVAHGVTLEVLAVHWTSSTPGLPIPKVGEVVRALQPPKYDYNVHGTYVVSLSYGSEAFGYEWWLDTGLTENKQVIQNLLTDDAAESAINAADNADGDVDSASDLLSSLAEEWEERHAARDRGVPEANQPLGPGLQAMFDAAGYSFAPPKTDRERIDDFIDTVPESRVLPTEWADAPSLVDDLAHELDVDLVQVEALILFDDLPDSIETIAFFYPGIGRTSEAFVDRTARVTILRTLAPSDRGFVVVAFDKAVATDVGARHWSDTIADFSTLDFSVSPSGVSYIRIDLNSEIASAAPLSESQYFEIVDELRPRFERGETGQAPEPTG